MNGQSTGAPGLPDFVPVVLIGAGPTGITAATPLAQYGIDCLVQDRHETACPLPRAVHADDEMYRIAAHSNDDAGTQRRLTRNKIGGLVPSACDLRRATARAKHRPKPLLFYYHHTNR
jgi:hypothetical protein